MFPYMLQSSLLFLDNLIESDISTYLPLKEAHMQGAFFHPRERKCKEGETHELFFNLVAVLITLTLCFSSF